MQAEGLRLTLRATQGKMQIQDGSLDIQRFGFEPERKSLVVDAMALRLKAQIDTQAMALELDWPSLRVAGEAIEGGPLQGRLSATGPTSAQAEFRSGPPRGRFDLVELPGLQLRLKGRSGSHQLDGEAQALLTVQPQPLQVSLRNLRSSTRVETPGLQPQDLQLQGELQGSAGPSRWQLEGQLGNNRFTTRGELDLAPSVPRLQAQARFDRLNLNEVLAPSAAPKPAQPSPPPAGPTPVDLSALQAVQGRFELQAGELLYQRYRLAEARAGEAAVQVRDGAIKGFNLARALREARAALTLNRDALQQARATEQTDFSELNVSFQIAEGVARSNDLDMKSPFLRVGGEGQIDIGRNRIDYTVRAALTSTAQGQGGAELAALRGVTVPVRLTGPLEAIEWNVRWSAVAAQAATTQLRDKLEEQLKGRLGGKAAPAEGAASEPVAPRSLEDVAKDKLKDKLRGIFK